LSLGVLSVVWASVSSAFSSPSSSSGTLAPCKEPGRRLPRLVLNPPRDSAVSNDEGKRDEALLESSMLRVDDAVESMEKVTPIDAAGPSFTTTIALSAPVVRSRKAFEVDEFRVALIAWGFAFDHSDSFLTVSASRCACACSSDFSGQSQTKR